MNISGALRDASFGGQRLSIRFQDGIPCSGEDFLKQTAFPGVDALGASSAL